VSVSFQIVPAEYQIAGRILQTIQAVPTADLSTARMPAAVAV